MDRAGPTDPTLHAELAVLRRRIAELEAAEAQRAPTEQALKESEEKFRSICASAQDAVLMQDAEGRISFWNAAATRIFGYSEEEAIGKELHTLLAPQRYHSAYQAGLSSFRKTGEGPAIGKTLELAAVRQDGSEFPMELSVSVVKLREHWHAIGVVRDISNRKRTEAERAALVQQLQQSQKLEAIGTLAGGVAHDMNNILGAIMMLASVIRSHTPADHPRHRDVEDILAACRRGRDLTKNLLGFARKGLSHRDHLSLNAMIETIKALLQRTISKQITIEMALDPDLPEIEGEVSQLHQALMNVALNAVDALDGAGTLRFATGRFVRQDSERDEDPDLPADVYARVEVVDTGVGMDAQTRERAFEPFFTTKPVGQATGLGLAMVFGAVQNHDGVVTIDSAPGRGAAVRITLPATSTPQRAANASATASSIIRPSKGTVLLVEDEELVCDGTQRMLEHLGWRVLVANNGKAALDCYRGAGKEIDVVLLDLIMPVMDGEEAFRKLKAMDASVQIVPCSGYATEATQRDLLALGAAGFLCKPYDVDQLARVIARAIQGPPVEEA